MNELADAQRSEACARSRTHDGNVPADVRGARQLLRAAEEVRDARNLIPGRKWADLLDLTSRMRSLVNDGADALMLSPALTVEDRVDIGWSWGHCGWRRCGARADVEHNLSKLQEGLGMFVPAEAAYYVDVTTRGIDEMVAICHARGLLSDEEWSPLAEYRYLDLGSLNAILGEESFNGEDWNL